MHSYLSIRKHFSFYHPNNFVTRALSVVFLSLFLISCGPPQKDEAVQAFETWIFAVRMGDGKQVWQSLSQKTQAYFIKQYHQTHQSKEISEPFDPNHFSESLSIQLDWSFESPFAQNIKLKTSQALFRSVTFFYGQKHWEIPMVKEDGVWKIHLQAAQVN